MVLSYLEVLKLTKPGQTDKPTDRICDHYVTWLIPSAIKNQLQKKNDFRPNPNQKKRSQPQIHHLFKGGGVHDLPPPLRLDPSLLLRSLTQNVSRILFRVIKGSENILLPYQIRYVT